MTDRICTVAVDVGNSAVKLCVRRDDSAKKSGAAESSAELSDGCELNELSIPFTQSNWLSLALQWVSEQIGCQRSDWRIASVHQSAAKTLEDAVAGMQIESAAEVSLKFVSRHHVPMKVNVDQPDRLGIDRLLSAFGACNQLGGPLTVVDAGSAVTIDRVDGAGEFCGGAIMPGLRMQAESLAKGTDALPEIEWQTSVEDTGNCQSAAASNTVDAIRLGLITSVTAAIDRLAEDYAGSDSATKSKAQLVLTGGDAPTISPYVRHPHRVMPNLVCRGLLDLA